ncbi:DNA helicase [Tanacetum coccineum]|uniref:DNA helicase n=1 Tax=Tanacetum coccineum TaxID=301880 RepID=A0ABQ5HP32_9ASTR
MTYLSNDEAIPVDKDTGETEILYPSEYLNTMKFPGFPPHKLQLKVGSPIMLLRNVNLSGGLCNDTRMIVRSMRCLAKMLETTIATLRLGQRNRTLEAKVYRKWILKSALDMREIAFCCMTKRWFRSKVLRPLSPKTPLLRVPNKMGSLYVSCCKMREPRPQKGGTLRNKCGALGELMLALSTRYVPREVQLGSASFQVTKYRFEDPEMEKIRNYQTFHTLLQQNPTGFKKVSEVDGEYNCEDHGQQDPPTYKYNFKANATDGTANVQFTFFTPARDKVTGHPCSKLAEKYKQVNKRHTPSEIRDIIGKIRVF